MEHRWNEEHASTLADDLDRLVYLSNLVGADPALTQPGGGNSSIKLRARDLAGREISILSVKGSGTDLATITRAGFAGLRMDDLGHLRERGEMSDEEMMKFMRACMLDASEPAPSVETPLHALLPYRCIIHTHDLVTQALTDNTRKGALVREALGEEAAVIGYVRPGFPLARAVMGLGDLGKARGLVLGKHGLVAWGDNPRACYDNLHRLITRAETFLAGGKKEPFKKARCEPAAPADRDRAWRDLLPPLRGRLSRHGRVVLHVDDSDEAVRFAGCARAKVLHDRGMATPEHILRCGRKPLYVDTVRPDTAAVLQAVDDYEKAVRVSFGKHMRPPEKPEPTPRVILLPGFGIVTAHANKKRARLADTCYRHVIRVMEAVERIDEFRFLDEAGAFEIEYWPLERRKVRPPEGELASRVALVTGGAGGIGRAIAERFVAAGAHVAITDVDLEAARETAREIGDADRVLGLKANATDEAATAGAVGAVIREYGGLDILVCNAGRIQAGPMESLSREDWDRLVAINQTGCFLASKEAARVMKAQGTGGVILFNASKAAFTPTVNNLGYAVTKAAVAHMARSLAAELAPAGIRVNYFNADFIDTPLFRRHAEERARQKGISVEKALEGYRARNLLKVGPMPPSAVAEAALFLASDRSAYTTGGVLTVDGGLTDAMPR